MGNRSLHFAVGAPDPRRSQEWVVATSGGDAYITAAGLGGTLKASLHESGQWQTALVQEFYEKKPSWLEANARFATRWNRPRPLGANVTLAFRILIPTSELREWADDRNLAKVRWVAPPDEGLVEFQIWIRYGPKRTQDEWPGKTGRGTLLVGEMPLGTSDAVVVTYLFEPPSRHIEGQLGMLRHVTARQGPDYESRRGPWRPSLRGLAEVLLQDGSVAWLEFAEPGDRPPPDLSPEEA